MNASASTRKKSVHPLVQQKVTKACNSLQQVPVTCQTQQQVWGRLQGRKKWICWICFPHDTLGQGGICSINSTDLLSPKPYTHYLKPFLENIIFSLKYPKCTFFKWSASSAWYKCYAKKVFRYTTCTKCVHVLSYLYKYCICLSNKNRFRNLSPLV